MLATFASIALLASCARGLTPGSIAGDTPSSAPAAAGSPTAAASSPSAVPTSTPNWRDRTPLPECVNPPPDALALIYQSDPVACYGHADLTVEGSLLSSLGVVDCFLFVEPVWLSCPPDGGLQVVLETAQAAPIVLAVTKGNQGPWLFFKVHPATGITLADYDGRTVRVTGHYDDPAAQTCRIMIDYSHAVTPAEAIMGCRGTFVVTRIVPAVQ
jgi:hypothetical protein